MSDSYLLEPALDAAVRVFDAFSLRHALVGALGAGAWGAVRMTDSVDFYAELTAQMRANVRSAFERREFQVATMDDELSRHGMFRALHAPTGVPVHVVDANNPVGEMLLTRRKKLNVHDKVRWVASAEDVGLLAALSDREVDLEDLVSLLAVGKGTFDLAYVEGWIQELGRARDLESASIRLRRAREEAEKRAPRK